MSDSPKEHQDKEDEKEDKHEEEKSGKEKMSNLYSRFVHTFEQALNAVAYGKQPSSSGTLSSLTLEGIADYIKTKKPCNVIVMSGAGISTSAGIPDFRSPGSGLYDNLQKYNIPDPQAIFEINYFESNPEPFFQLAKNLFPKHIKPTPAHHFVRLLEKKGCLRRWYTQNIDTLEYETEIEEDKVVTAHGSHRTSTCRSCGKKYDMKWMTDILYNPDKLVPHCDDTKCSGIVKPDIVFFGENLSRRFFACTIKDFPKCDLLIIMGTSLVVQPFAGLIHEVSDEVPRLLLNLEAAAQALPGEFATGLCYALKDNHRDVFHKGTCDDGVRKLAELLDWELELDQLIAEAEIKHKAVLSKQ